MSTVAIAVGGWIVASILFGCAVGRWMANGLGPDRNGDRR